MSEQEKYDELIRQKFAEKEFMFNEANWEKAEMMIDSSRKIKKFFWWGSIFLIGLIAGVCLMFPLIKHNLSHPSHEANNSNEQVISKNTTNSTNSITDNTSNNEKQTVVTDASESDSSGISFTNNQTTNENDLSDVKNDASHLKSNVYRSLNKKENSSSTKNKSGATTASAQLNTNNVSGASYKKQDAKNNETSSVNASELKTSKLKKGKNKNAAEINNDNSLHSETNTAMISEEKKKKLTTLKLAATSTSKKDSKTKSKLKANETVNQEAGNEEAKNEKTKNEETKDTKIADGLVKKKLSSTDPTSEAADSALTEKKPAPEDLASKIDSLNDSTKQEEKKLADADSIKKADSVAVAGEKKAPAPGLDGLAAATFFSIDGGINGQLGWKNNTGASEGQGITAVLGLGVTHAFNQTWSVYTGVQYNGISNLKGGEVNTVTTSYGFGSITTILTIKPSYLHYIAVPLFVQFHLNDKNAVMLGGSLSYLLNAKTKTEANTSRVAPTTAFPDSVSTMQLNDANYYSKPYNPYDATFSVGYRRKISSRFSIAAIANFGLMNIKKDAFFRQNKFERNSGLKVVLSYNIFDF